MDRHVCVLASGYLRSASGGQEVNLTPVDGCGGGVVRQLGTHDGVPEVHCPVQASVPLMRQNSEHVVKSQLTDSPVSNLFPFSALMSGSWSNPI